MDFIGKILFRAAGGDWRAYFWMRQAFHFAGGVGLGLLGLMLTGYLATVCLWIAMNAVLVPKEIIEDGLSQLRVKTYADLIAWNVGFLAVSWVKFA